ncbi:MAG TPA: DUF4326 domain-containing protein [Blastocatellia bacterium]|nr:DUF4326 domain-containing protein [Blastocatellia bacterium]
MICEIVEIGGHKGFVCSSGRRAARCKFCQGSFDLECDYPTRGGTCDARMCRACALHIEPNEDYCPTHAPFVFVIDERKIVIVNKRNVSKGTCVDRTTPLGNPFKLKGEDTPEARAECLAKYRRWLWALISHEPSSKEVFMLTDLARRIKTEDLTLTCFCAPKSCHAQIIARAIKWLVEGNSSANEPMSQKVEVKL